jgi:type IV pilus assembly protein PilE
MALPQLGRRSMKCQHSHMLLSEYWLARPRERGFTLIELLITVAIVAIVASLAYPSFMGAVRKSRRAEAVDMITRLQQTQERRRATEPTYAAASGVTTQHGYYQVSVDVAPPTAGSRYTITATASGSQAADTMCATMSVTVDRGNITYDSTSGQRCWAK